MLTAAYPTPSSAAAPTTAASAMTRREKLLSALGLAVLAAIVALAFRAYFTPAMLIDFVSLRLCS